MAVDQNLARSLLTDAKTRYESARRWSLVTVLVLLLLHVMTVGPFVRAQIERAAVAEEQRSLREASADLSTSLQTQQRVMQEIRDALDAMLAAKKADFDALQSAVVAIRAAQGQETSGTDGLSPDFGAQDPLFVQAPVPQLQAQVPQLRASARSDVFVQLIQQDGLAGSVAAAESGDELRTILRPIIEREIIEPRFARVNAVWGSRQPELAEGAGRIRQRFAELAAEFPETPLWSEMSAEAASYRAALDNVVFGPPPDDPDWWHTVVGKDAAVLQMKEVDVGLLSPESFTTASTALQGWLDDRDVLIADLDGQLAELEAQFDQQQQRLAGLIAPISGVALDLSIVVGDFPLALAVLLGMAMIWPERRYRELVGSAELARRAGLIEAQDGELFLPGGNARLSLFWSLGGVVLAVAWILLASRQLAAWSGREGPSLVVITGVAILIVAAIGIWKIRAAAARVA